MDFTIDYLASNIKGKIIGFNDFFSNNGFTGKFTFLNDAKEGDIVIRHWINDKGIEIASSKNIACLITQTPKDGAIKKAIELNFPLIIVDKIELANSFALEWVIEKYSPDSKNIIVTGTNGKSTTSHLIYHILKSSGFKVFSNTDSKSEFNTLIDPMVSKLMYDKISIEGKQDFLVIEISEVQGWLGSLMKNHAYLMSKSINPNVGVITNISMDHIGLVNSVSEIFDEISQVPKTLNNGVLVLNSDDNLVKKLGNGSNVFNTSMDYLPPLENNIYYDLNKKAVFYRDKIILNEEELPFSGYHFIQNILLAIATCISLDLDITNIVKGLKSYKSLDRRFSKLNNNPLIIDDFAHNPEGIIATINETSKITPKNRILYIVCSIRGSRGLEINEINAKALVNSFKENMKVVLSSSSDVVDNLNHVEEFEKNIFFQTLDDNNIEYTHFDKLYDALKYSYSSASKEDVILLIGAQGMDPASTDRKSVV